MMLMTGVAALAAAVPVPQAAAEPEVPGQPVDPGAPPPEAAPVNVIFADDFDGPAGAPPDLSKWTVVSWNEPVTPPILGLFRDDRRNVFLDGNGNLVLRATKEGNTYFSGRVESKHEDRHRAHLGSPDEAQLPRSRLLARVLAGEHRGHPRRPGTSAGRRGRHRRVVRQRSSGLLEPRCTPDQTARPGRSTGGRSTASGTPTGANGMTRASSFWMDDFAGPPYFTVPAGPIDGAWPFNAPDYLLFTIFNLAVGGPGGGDPNFGSVLSPGDAHRLRTRLVAGARDGVTTLRPAYCWRARRRGPGARRSAELRHQRRVRRRRRAAEGLGDGQHPAGQVPRRPVAEHVPVPEPAGFLAAVQQLPVRGELRRPTSSPAGMRYGIRPTFVDILPTDVAVSLNNVTLTDA